MVDFYLKSLLSCNFDKLPEVITEDLHFKGDTQCIIKCSRGPSNPFKFFIQDMIRNRSLRHTPCLGRYMTNPVGCNALTLSEQCKTADVISLKLLRYDLSDLNKRMENDKNVFLVHEFRDPRGTIQSFIRENKDLYPPRLILLTRALCNMISHDLGVLQKLKHLFPNRIKVIKYEDFAKDPIYVTKQIYKLINQPLSKEVISWILLATRGLIDSGKFKRRNSTDTALRWRRTMTKSNKEMVQQECQHVRVELERLGYNMSL